MGAPPQVSLDYGSDNLPADQRKKLLGSLSAVTEANGFLWTAADEGRTLECLKRDGNKGYARKQQYQRNLWRSAGRARGQTSEADIESLSVSNAKLLYQWPIKGEWQQGEERRPRRL